MLIHTATRPLGPVDCVELTRQVLALDDSAWAAESQRQLEHDVHAQTQSVLLLSCHGWPDVTVVQCAGWPLLHEAALPVMNEIIGYSRHGSRQAECRERPRKRAVEAVGQSLGRIRLLFANLLDRGR